MKEEERAHSKKKDGHTVEKGGVGFPSQPCLEFESGPKEVESERKATTSIGGRGCFYRLE